ncbi:transposase [Sphingomonas sp. SORGH_AS 950]|uniref:IS110 family transposase n=1 Tax=Sphingomonas sp. SORGH_AS_0950 TaxID=3041792 RepID=UPI002786007A|nr:transposase [Sphingomonas sp. SORGH_AS_0950]MDQ1158960.1 transposase [Sphingomonas sp. SORGH_AS_0950]
MICYVGLDVSMKETAICVVDETGDRIWDGKSRTDPDAIAAVLARRAVGAVRIGIETGPMTVWLWHALTERELPIVCLHARHAAAALKLQMNKTDRNDAFGLARLVRSGWYRPVAVRSMDTHRLRDCHGLISAFRAAAPPGCGHGHLVTRFVTIWNTGTTSRGRRSGAMLRLDPS